MSNQVLVSRFVIHKVGMLQEKHHETLKQRYFLCCFAWIFDDNSLSYLIFGSREASLMSKPGEVARRLSRCRFLVGAITASYSSEKRKVSTGRSPATNPAAYWQKCEETFASPAWIRQPSLANVSQP